MPRFRPRVLPTIGMALGVGLFGSLGTWQLRRMDEAAAERERWQSRVEAPPFEAAAPPVDPDLRRARVEGVPDWDRYVVLVNRPRQGVLGVNLVVPVAVGEAPVLVDVGWVPADGIEAAVAQERARGSRRTYEGLARVLGEDAGAGEGVPVDADGFRRYWRDWAPQAMGNGRRVAAFVVTDGPRVAAGRESPDTEVPIAGWAAEPHERPHGEYAATWFGILAVLVGLWAHASVRGAETPTRT